MEFNLNLADKDVTGGNIAVSWCLSKELIEELVDSGAQDPSVVIVIAPEGDSYDSSKELRKVVPLRDLVAYVDFRYPGKNKIWGFISKRNVKIISNRYLERYSRGYSYDILSNDGTEYARSFIVNHWDYVSLPISVDIPKECFAPEPSQFEKDWVMWLNTSKAFDQCEFRRKRLFAYTVQPVLFLINMFVKFVFFVAGLMICSKNLNLKWLIHPLAYDIAECFEFIGESALIRDSQNFFKRYGLLLISPPALILYFALWYFNVAWIGLISLAAIIVCVSLVPLFFWLVSKVKDSQFSADENEAEVPWYSNQEEANLLLCSANEVPRTYKTVPKNHKSIRLTFQHIKSKVCRPYAG
ncbi:MAG: hypothetical protein LC122_13825 [Chitinophagales bacterium]|nr:hypothetical protein [Chitinophagales bacterium]